MTTGVMPPQIGKHFAAALEIDDTLADAVLAATEGQRQDEAGVMTLAREADHRASFKPYLRVETARTRPEPIFIAAILGVDRLLKVRLPDDVSRAVGADRDRLVKRAIQDHYRERQGWVPAFGTITGYTLVTLPGYRSDFGWPYDVEGDPAGSMRPVRRLGEPALGVKRGDNRLGEIFRENLTQHASAK